MERTLNSDDIPVEPSPFQAELLTSLIMSKALQEISGSTQQAKSSVNILDLSKVREYLKMFGLNIQLPERRRVSDDSAVPEVVNDNLLIASSLTRDLILKATQSSNSQQQTHAREIINEIVSKSLQ